MEQALEWWERVCRPIRWEAPGGPADVPPQTWALVLAVNARMHENVAQELPLECGSDPAASLAALGLPARVDELPWKRCDYNRTYYQTHRAQLCADARRRYREKVAHAAV